MEKMLKAAKAAKIEISNLSENQKNDALYFMAQALIDNEAEILAANAEDVKKAKGTVSEVMIDRLMLNPERIAAMAKGIKEVAALPNPVGRVLESHTREDGLKITKVSVPMGVIAIIYESRPNVTSDAAALALKSGNVCVLRGGKEAFNSASAIVRALRQGLNKAGITEDAVNLVTDTSRQSATELMTADKYIDLLIPRGGAGLINACVQNATVPCIATGTGICHIYVDEFADFDKAIKILVNAKTQRPSVCNAAEVLIVHKNIAKEFLPLCKKALCEDKNVELRLCKKTAQIIDGKAAGENDFDTEFLDYIMAVKTVESIDEAIEHISAHSTGHSDAIVSENEDAQNKFTSAIDSAAVYVNASTRFTDGGEFGLGCEMGISTQKMHARGPMGIEELTTYKYIIKGNGHIR